MNLHDRPGMERTKYRTQTVLVVAITKPPALQFRVGGRTVACGEEVRVPLYEARDLVRRGKARIVPDSEEMVLM